MQRMTKQRQAVMSAIAESNEFRSAQQVYSDMSQAGSRVSLATVYRNLQLLEEQGLVEAIRSQDGEFLYRQCDEAHHHHHLICRNCNRSVAITDDAMERFIARAADEHGFTQVEHAIDIFGLCNDCAANPDTSSR